MEVVINGTAQQVKDCITVAELLKTLGIQPELVVVEHNRSILKRDRFSITRLTAADQLEIVQFVGGGAFG